MDSRLKPLGQVVLTKATMRRTLAVLMLMALVVGWFVWLRPTALGGPITMIRVTGQSMEPGMYTGDLAVVRADDSYETGEIVAYRVPTGEGDGGPHVIHRIVGDDGDVLTLRGDNNGYDDPWTVRDRNIVGQLWFELPGAGSVVGKLLDPVVAASLCAALTAFLILMGGPRTKRGAREDIGADPADVKQGER